jgi:nucleoside-diphosphate-sugar epimerase
LIYGPGVKANFSSLLKVANLNLPLPLGAVENKRSFVALDNLINLIICCIDHPKAANQIFHVSDDDDISTSELYTIMVKAFGKKPRLINIKPRSLKSIAQILGKGDIADRLCDDLQLDIEHTKRTLDWKPTLKVKEGIKLCASHLINNE